MNKVCVITGCGKGLGLELCNQAIQRGYCVIAMTYPMTEAVLNLAKEYPRLIFPYEVDVTDQAAIDACKAEVFNKFKSIDLIINNAGIWLDVERLELEDENFDTEMCYKEFDVNAMGALRITRAFIPQLRKSQAETRALVYLSSDCASYKAQNERKAEYAYCMSKACVNMIANLINNAVTDTNIKVLSIFPGWMQTDMGYAGAKNAFPNVPPAEAAECIFTLINEPKKAYTFMDRFGAEMD